MYKIIFHKNNKEYSIDLDKSYSLEEAIQNVKEIRKSGNSAELFPEQYSIPKVTEEQAWDIALSVYNEYHIANPNNYGELTIGLHTPIYYCFYCRDFEKEEEGMSPGRLFIRIDKLSGKKLSKEEIREYDKLNYSF